LSTEITNITIELDEALARFRDDLGEGRRRNRGSPRGDPILTYSFSSQDEYSTREEGGQLERTI